MLNAKEAQTRLAAAHTLLLDPSTTREKFTAIREMIHGLNPGLDNALWRVDSHFSTWDKLANGEVIHLSAENLPEITEEEKKRKKYVLFLIIAWKDLKGEVERVQAEMLAAQNAKGGDKASHWGRIFKHAKGPLGLITVVAVGVAVMSQTAVAITIENKGCATMHPSGGLPISIPGLKLPSEPIASGGSAVATLPGMTVQVDGASKGALVLSVLNYTLSFQLPNNISDVTLNGTSLLNKKTEVKLSEKDEHTLKLICS